MPSDAARPASRTREERAGEPPSMERAGADLLAPLPPIDAPIRPVTPLHGVAIFIALVVGLGGLGVAVLALLRSLGG